MADDVAAGLGNMKLTADEEEIIPISDEGRVQAMESCSLSLIGKFLTCKPFNKRAAKTTLRKAWGLENSLQIIEVGPNLFQFKFKTEFDMARILQDGPWSFDNQLLLLQRWQKGMTVGNIRLEHASLWIQIWGAPFDMVSPQVAREVGNRIGRVEEVEGQRRQDELNYFMRVKVAVPIGKPLRRGGFIAGSDGARSWVTFKYERLPLFCHYCGLLGHDVKHCASHFAVSRNGGEVDYQYGESLRALGGRSCSFPSRNTYGSAGPAKEQTSDESTNYSPVQGTFPAAGVEDTTPSKQEVESENLGELPIFQEEANVELGGTDDVQEGRSLQLVPSPVCEDTDVDLAREVTGQPAGIDCMEVATGKNKEAGLGVEASGLDQRLELVGPSSVKPKSTWTRFNRMDFGLGGLSKALQLPNRGKRSNVSSREEELCDHSDFREKD